MVRSIPLIILTGFGNLSGFFVPRTCRWLKFAPPNLSSRGGIWAAEVGFPLVSFDDHTLLVVFQFGWDDRLLKNG
jgi:hypothetical protein